MRWLNSEYIRCFFTICFYDSKNADLDHNQIHTSRSRIHPRQLYWRPFLQLGNVTTAVRISFARRALCFSFEKEVEGILDTVVTYKGCVLSPACASSAPAGSRCLSAPLPCSGNGNCGEELRFVFPDVLSPSVASFSYATILPLVISPDINLFLKTIFDH